MANEWWTGSWGQCLFVAMVAAPIIAVTMLDLLIYQCAFLGHRWTETGDVNIRFRECSRCGEREMSVMLQPWKPV